jgi:hypothetical protein
MYAIDAPTAEDLDAYDQARKLRRDRFRAARHSTKHFLHPAFVSWRTCASTL